MYFRLGRRMSTGGASRRCSEGREFVSSESGAVCLPALRPCCWLEPLDLHLSPVPPSRAPPAATLLQDVTISWGECNHCFHLECISRWLRSNNTCPLCSAEWVSARVQRHE